MSNILWQGSFAAVHSFAHINRQLCTRLLEQGHDVVLAAACKADPPGAGVALPRYRGSDSGSKRRMASQER